ncbi:hypothetical protein GCM10011608_12080 [Micromonospora sonchi]|uniref:Uncharacterized protein n=1 Tax=Micromonospora sonchi TaxID=1763543 RepID=A0A917TN38_9ACTN|nr:hypothetical protein GCM10011608_12080 [Micromonospora sonchi]
MYFWRTWLCNETRAPTPARKTQKGPVSYSRPEGWLSVYPLSPPRTPPIYLVELGVASAALSWTVAGLILGLARPAPPGWREVGLRTSPERRRDGLSRPNPVFAPLLRHNRQCGSGRRIVAGPGITGSDAPCGIWAAGPMASVSEKDVFSGQAGYRAQTFAPPWVVGVEDAVDVDGDYRPRLVGCGARRVHRGSIPAARSVGRTSAGCGVSGKGATAQRPVGR